MNHKPDIWAIGDVQGCCASLRALLADPDIASDTTAQIWFAGDLINRGPDSLGALRQIMALGERAVTVLGNHDLHLLAVAAGVKNPGKSDTIGDILNAPDRHELIDWLRHRPLAHYARGHLLVHAGVMAAWSVEKTLSLSAEIEAVLQSTHWRSRLQDMYGNKPSGWDDSLTGNKRLRVIVNALTRMRMCDAEGRMEFTHKTAPRHDDAGLIPWFDVAGRLTRNDTIIFGHWSTLGLMVRPDVICLDSGCVWGRKLTAIRLRDRKIVQSTCTQYQEPGHHQGSHAPEKILL